MSTRGIIARTNGAEGQFIGRYVHADSYPTGLGAYLWKLFHGHFHRDLTAMLRILVDEHPAGWSSLVGKDFRLNPGYTWELATRGASFEVYSKRPDYRRPQCYCHGMRHEEPQVFTHEDLKENNAGLEWLYVFDEAENRLFIRDLGHGEELIVELGDPEPDWKLVECGPELKRCSHYAWVHFPEMEGTNLSTLAYLGKAKLEMRDAIAFIVNGKRYQNTGCGRHSSFVMRGCENRFPPDLWIATVARNGRRRDIPVAKIRNGKYTPYSGVSWVYPPTKDNPNETVVTVREVA
jgi:hypothetical protein